MTADTINETDARLVREFASSEVGREFAARQEAERLARATRLVAEIDEIRARHAKSLPPLVSAATAATMRVRDVEAALIDARRAEGAAHAIADQARHDFDREVGGREVELRSLAINAIADFERDLSKLEDDSRQAIRAHEGTSPPNRISGLRTRQVFTNAESINRHLAAVRDARAACAAMRTEALSQTETLARIAKLRASIPPIAAATFGGVEASA